MGLANSETLSNSALLHEVRSEGISERLLPGSKEDRPNFGWRSLGPDGSGGLVHGRWWSWCSYSEGAGLLHQRIHSGRTERVAICSEIEVRSRVEHSLSRFGVPAVYQISEFHSLLRADCPAPRSANALQTSG